MIDHTMTTTNDEMADLQLDDAGSSWIDTYSALDPKVRGEWLLRCLIVILTAFDPDPTHITS